MQAVTAMNPMVRAPYFGTQKSEPIDPNKETIVEQSEQPLKSVRPPKRKGFIQTALASARNVFLLLLAAIGGGQVYDAAIGDGRMPRLHRLEYSAPNLTSQVYHNSSAHLVGRNDVDEETYWIAMQPALDLVKAVAPEITDWVKTTHQAGKVRFYIPGHAPDSAIAGYQPLTSQLFIGELFWSLPDGDKAAALAHEYRHSRQNIPKAVSVRLTQLIAGRLLEYPSDIEDEAYLYQQEFYQALGMRPFGINGYLNDRDLNHID